MNLQTFLRKYAERTGNTFIEYTDTIDVITISLPEAGRFQNVAVYMVSRDGHNMIEFLSKICPVTEYLDFKALLELNQELCYSKLVIHEEMLQAAATVRYDFATEPELIAMMEEVARIADQLELELTGQDMN